VRFSAGEIRCHRRKQGLVARSSLCCAGRQTADGPYREIVRQQYNFSPPDATDEREDYTVDVEGLTNLELSIVPDISGGPERASLAQLRVA
jgi:hypothetical protein